MFALLARAYHAYAAALAKLQQFDAAWVAADRAISDAGRAGDPLLMAEGAFRLTLVFQGSLVEQGIPEALSVYGALALQLAVVAARTERDREAWRNLDRARDVAERLGADRNDYHTEFGPTNVKLHEVGVAIDLGDAGDAIRRAADIDASKLSADRRGRLPIDVARAWTQRRNVERALATLEDAEQITPEQIYNHRLVHTMVADLSRMEPNVPASQDFARRAGVTLPR